jgi:hypothetical protein
MHKLTFLSVAFKKVEPKSIKALIKLGIAMNLRGLQIIEGRAIR